MPFEIIGLLQASDFSKNAENRVSFLLLPYTHTYTFKRKTNTSITGKIY